VDFYDYHYVQNGNPELPIQGLLKERLTMQDQVVICQKCHNIRTADLKTPCASCGASRTIFGYLYQHEYRTAFQATAAVLAVVFLAILLGIGFLIYQWYLMASRLGGLEVNDLAFVIFFHHVLSGGQI
jgi:hypothetical protein